MTLHHRILLGLLSVTLFAPPLALAREPQAPAPLPIEQMRAVAYTKDFAQRFALPDPEPGMEPSGGLQAMEFAVEDAKAKYPHKQFATYQCTLKLYLDNKLPIAYPEEGVSGDHRRFIAPTYFFLWPDPDNKHWLKLSEKDRRHFSERGLKYANLTWLATPNYVWQKQGSSVSMFYEEYHRDLFPGLAYTKIDMACPAYSWVDKTDAVQIWLKREGAKDYGKQLKVEPEDFLKFTIPHAFYRKIIGWTKETARYNRDVIDKKSKPQSN